MRVAVLLALGFLLSGCAMGGTKTTTLTVTRTVTSPSGPVAQGETASVEYFGSPASATKIDQHCPAPRNFGKQASFSCYALTIKPEFYLVGVTANVAFAAGETPPKTCEPLACPAVEDDRWVIPAGTQNLTFILPAAAKGTVLTLNNSQMQKTITGTQLAAIVDGATTPKLMEPLDSGVWVTVNVDTVTSFDQQFQP